MKVTLCVNVSENNTIGKDFAIIRDVDCIIKGECSIHHPTLILQNNSFNDDLNKINYIHIAEWGRYYFIRNIRVTRGSCYEIECEVDVLESFKESIKNLNVILNNTQDVGSSNYLPSDVFLNNVKSKTDILNFPNGLNDSGEFILITAGG